MFWSRCPLSESEDSSLKTDRLDGPQGRFNFLDCVFFARWWFEKTIEKQKSGEIVYFRFDCFFARFSLFKIKTVLIVF